MKIKKRDTEPERVAQLRTELGALSKGCAGQTVPCAPNCPHAKPDTCSRYCAEVGIMLSSDPENYPIEEKIAPLVYELKSLSVFEPCWSCEGHTHNDGKLWKLPRVWFYSSSTAHVRILGECLEDLHCQGVLNSPWRVAVTYSDDDNVDTTFCIEPTTDDGSCPLGMLQKDISTIADHLAPLIRDRIAKLSSNL